MNSNKITWIFVAVFGTIGGFIPLLWGETAFSFSSLIFNGIGGIFGIWLAYRIKKLM